MHASRYIYILLDITAYIPQRYSTPAYTFASIFLNKTSSYIQNSSEPIHLHEEFCKYA